MCVREGCPFYERASHLTDVEERQMKITNRVGERPDIHVKSFIFFSDRISFFSFSHTDRVRPLLHQDRYTERFCFKARDKGHFPLVRISRLNQLFSWITVI